MTNKEYALYRIHEIIEALNQIVVKIENGDNPQNNDWVNAAAPMHDIMNIMGNFDICKDEEFDKSRFTFNSRPIDNE